MANNKHVDQARSTCYTKIEPQVEQLEISLGRDIVGPFEQMPLNQFLDEKKDEEETVEMVKKRKEGIRMAEFGFVVITSAIITILYTMMTFHRAWTCFGHAVRMQASGFYYMIIISGLMWINTTTGVAIASILCGQNNKRTPKSYPLIFFIIWKVIMVCLITAVLIVALGDSSIDRDLALPTIQFGFPLILHAFTYLVYLFARHVCVVKN